MEISGNVLNAVKKRENTNKILNIETNSTYYSRQGKIK